MKKRLSFIAGLLFICSGIVLAQPVEVDVFQKTATATSTQIGIRVRATGANVDYIGVTFYILYQSANASPINSTPNTGVGIDDSKLATTYLWGTGSRFTNPAQVVSIDPGAPGGQVYNRRFVYGNSDDAGGANLVTLTTAWDTLVLITLNTLQPLYPQGGFAYIQSTAEAGGAALTDPSFSNIAYSVNSGDRPLGLNTLPVTFTKYDVTCNDKGALLTWTTGSEQNSSKFEIQRSLNGIDWTSIDNVAAAGNSTDQRNYQYLDLYGGTAFYRIRQVDIDGRFVYTAVKRTECQKSQYDVALYPVPARDNLNVVIRSEINTRTEIQILDINGRSLRRVAVQINKGNNNIQLSVGNLPAGQYMLVGSDPSIQINKKFTIIR
ncbi:MAG: T9SS type A sorting domain-containing protein [Chitinophagaceae bacterium]|nr:T9SS type A sorting domain-containing protein [Chitinophagaceae bacterium]